MGKGKKKDGEDVYEKEPPTEKELQLKAELEATNEDLLKMRQKIEELKEENEFMQQEAQTTKVETHEYLNYMKKKKERREACVVTLSDSNAVQISEIREKKNKMLGGYQQQKQELRDVILSKEMELSKLRQELAELKEYKVLRDEQQSEITSLEKKVCQLRNKHNEAVHNLQVKFLTEKIKYQDESEEQLKALSKDARKEAQQCLHKHITHTKSENRLLRKELMQLLQKTRSLHEHKLRLEEEKKILLREKETADKIHAKKRAREEKSLNPNARLQQPEDDFTLSKSPSVGKNETSCEIKIVNKELNCNVENKSDFNEQDGSGANFKFSSLKNLQVHK